MPTRKPENPRPREVIWTGAEDAAGRISVAIYIGSSMIAGAIIFAGLVIARAVWGAA